MKFINKNVNKTFVIKKGRRKTSKAVIRFDDRCTSLLINHKPWTEYFSDSTLTKKISDLITNYESDGGKKIVGYISCFGGGCTAQCRSICDALGRFAGVKVNTDIRQRRRNTPGRDVFAQKPNNKR